jgi:2,4-diketo-3-deoxy-L-fuconate hydrolase
MNDISSFALGTFSEGNGPAFTGLVMEERVLPLRNLSIVGAETMLMVLEDWERNFDVLREVCADASAARRSAISVADLRVHAPVPHPGTVYCSGANYRKHVVDLIVAHQEPAETQGMTLEQKRAWGMKLMDERARTGTPFIFVTLREKVFRRKSDSPELGMDFTISKGAPSFLPMGPYLMPAVFVGDPQRLRLTLKLNGQVMQDEETGDMIFTVAHLIEYLSASVELRPGDVICTGSPAGNGMLYNRFIQEGDVLEGTIASRTIDLGTQRNPCVLEKR